jgi:hypothetical protein
MRDRLRTPIAIALLLATAASSDAEVLVRWTERRVPSPQFLAVPALLIPSASRDSVREALTHGYRVYVELPASAAATYTPPGQGLAGVVVKGAATRTQLAVLRERLGARHVRVLTMDERGAWPHIRANWVTKNNEVLQVAGRSAQPWIETNAALIRIANAASPDRPPLLVYDWAPSAVSGSDEGPALENYLVAIAEAGSFGADVILPLHDRFQRRLVLGHPEARRDWNDIRRYIDFYSGDLPRRYDPIASIGVVTSRPMAWYEAMKLLARHNLPFVVIAPSRLPSWGGPPPKLLVVFDELDVRQGKALGELERKGSLVRAVKEVPDPDRFALEMRQALGPDNRVVDIWNGITVLAAPYKEPDGEDVMLTLLNYAHQPLSVQLRVRGTFSRVHYESPDAPAVLLPHQSRDVHTEVVVPQLRIGGRLFFSRQP